jgi:hypothetical protein
MRIADIISTCSKCGRRSISFKVVCPVCGEDMRPSETNKRNESTCGHFNLAPYGCEHCFKSHEEIAAERDASRGKRGQDHWPFFIVVGGS